MEPAFWAFVLDRLGHVAVAGLLLLAVELLIPALGALRRRYWVSSEGMDPDVYERLRERSLRARAQYVSQSVRGFWRAPWGAA